VEASVFWHKKIMPLSMSDLTYTQNIYFVHKAEGFAMTRSTVGLMLTTRSSRQ